MNRNSLQREFLAEFLGTFVLLAFGSAVVTQVVLGGNKNGEYVSINIAWGFAVTMGIYVAGGVTGAHLNPAVTFALATKGELPWSKVLPYFAAQVLGAFCGAASRRRVKVRRVIRRPERGGAGAASLPALGPKVLRPRRPNTAASDLPVHSESGRFAA